MFNNEFYRTLRTYCMEKTNDLYHCSNVEQLHRGLTGSQDLGWIEWIIAVIKEIGAMLFS